MKKIFLTCFVVTALWGCKTANTSDFSKTKDQIQVKIDLTNIKNDMVLVTVDPPKINTDQISFHLPKMVPGTYSNDNYGKYIHNLKAYDNKGKLLDVKKTDDNTWDISNAQKLDKITYWVNDTYDSETGQVFGSEDIFSPAGSNIDTGKNIMLNTHCFVGYFSEYLSIPYQLTVLHPDTLWGATSMTDEDATTTSDLFITSRYAELIENPIMYAKPDHSTFTIDGMEIQIAVYSPTGKHTVENITPEMKIMMTAQKKFLGNINTTKKYTILLYLSSLKNDAMGFGALEHPTATTVVFPEKIPNEQLISEMRDVVSHEFFHIVTPLTVHSKEIQNFDYNDPKMSEHLWMYEGVTEYFANLFQINQGLIDETEFYSRMSEKIEKANAMNDSMPFTTMSANVLTQPYKDQYLNVYEKGALIGMCMDIIIREKSNGEKGILDLMKKLSLEYGLTKAFDDQELFAKITELTYPEVGEFLNTYVAGPTPIPYDIYLSKVGVSKTKTNKAENIFYKDENTLYISGTKRNEIIINPYVELSLFFKNLDLKNEDVILAINDKEYSTENVFEMLYDSETWKENDSILVKIKRNGIQQTIKGTVKLTYNEIETLQFSDTSKDTLKDAWLKG